MPVRIVIFGNSGSGKSTLAKHLSAQQGLAHFDLDTVAWQPTSPPQRRAIGDSMNAVNAFIEEHQGWVIEGCYADLIDAVSSRANKMFFLDLPVEQCIANAKQRPWEPHKYKSKAEQDANLSMLIDWIAAYYQRQDEFSQRAHQQLFASFAGEKVRLTSNTQLS